MADIVVVEAQKQMRCSFTREKSWEKYIKIVVSIKRKENHIGKISDCD